MENIHILQYEAFVFRSSIELCNKKTTDVITKTFPIMNCKFASLFLAFHYRTIWSDIEIILVCGRGENMVTHAWLEVDGYAIDITGDQYNLLDSAILNEEVIRYRPYPKVHVEQISRSYLYSLFEYLDRLILENDFSNIKKYFVKNMERSHESLLDDLDVNRSKFKNNRLS
ncbi:hypothetical protein HWQ46_21730 [Shewanella sp. D64]|uniref:hypothetical protein n=1 Tax=unclassified Shewanella TaxID=196818 RepID=UPI0022BA5F83|nr:MULTISPECIES: hypothetical protein [unclassified Shewanella]MEC4728161.1 hypothetical protein [Shewanella sp. D64]MEC4740281.1 hypothetical protein [Shewanella sp. E94]WBJ94404.1 hypothetical protein HWQ47_21425 [Shewanella sp. MTB7]